MFTVICVFRLREIWSYHNFQNQATIIFSHSMPSIAGMWLTVANQWNYFSLSRWISLFILIDRYISRCDLLLQEYSHSWNLLCTSCISAGTLSTAGKPHCYVIFSLMYYYKQIDRHHEFSCSPTRAMVCLNSTETYSYICSHLENTNICYYFWSNNRPIKPSASLVPNLTV